MYPFKTIYNISLIVNKHFNPNLAVQCYIFPFLSEFNIKNLYDGTKAGH